MPGDFVTDDNPSDRGRDHCRRLEGFEFLRKQSADMSSRGSVLQQQRTLKKLATMESGTKNEVPVQESTGFAEEIQDVGQRVDVFYFAKTKNLADGCGSINSHQFCLTLHPWLR